MKLGITDIIIGRWVKNQSKIAQQKKGSQRSRGFGLPQEEAMEHRLSKELDDAQAKGRQITHRWVTQHAKTIYRELYPY
jgi:hypothetical protein